MLCGNNNEGSKIVLKSVTMVLIITFSILAATFTLHQSVEASQLVFRTPPGAVSIPPGQS